MTTALIADDEPLLREHLATHLARLWPDLRIVAQARNGREAIELFDEFAPEVVFLDVHMPGLNGIDAARAIAERAQIVFVTAFEKYAVQAFEHGAVDYLVKPFEEARLAATVQRLRSRQAAAAQGPAHDALAPLLDALANQVRQQAPPRKHLQWIKASVGPSLRLIPVDEVVFMRSDEKYTLVVWQGGEALIRKTIRELADELDPEHFVQIHRSTIVALRHVAHVLRAANETADVHLRGRTEVLPVSRSYLHLFRQM
jgi:DNA-binding LytR/AlgR family response regulator